MLIKILLTVIFLAVTVGVGFYSRRSAKNVDGFVLGGRNVGGWLTAFAYGTSYFSAVVFVGYAGQFGWKYGMSASWIGVGNAIIGSLLAWLVLGKRTKLMTQHIQSRTMPDFFGTRYNDEWLRVIASVIAFVFLIPYTAGVYMGISKLFEMGFDIPYEYCAVIMATLTAVYVILGGYKATAINDFIQGIIMLFGITTVIAVVLHSQGGLIAAVDKMATLAPNTDDLTQKGSAMYANFQPGDFASWFGPNPMSLLGVVILTYRWWASSILLLMRMPFVVVLSSLPSLPLSLQADATSLVVSDVCLSIQPSIAAGKNLCMIISSLQCLRHFQTSLSPSSYSWCSQPLCQHWLALC